MLLGWVFPKCFDMEILIAPEGAPKKGDGLGQHPSARWQSHPMWLWGKKAGFGGKIPFFPMWGWPLCQGDGLMSLLDAGD